MQTNLLLLATLITGGMLATTTVAPGQGAGGQPFVACSADGSQIVAVFDGGGISNSIDAGVTWRSNNAPIEDWCAIVSSADGSTLVAAIQGAGGYTSTNSGRTWQPNGLPAETWGDSALACSQDGSKLVAAASQSGTVYTSTNSGSTWRSNNLPRLWWESVTSSADGMKLAAASSGEGGTVGAIYTSADAGDTWTSNNVPQIDWFAIASSADGNRLVAAPNGWGIYISTNAGLNWAQTSASADPFEFVASSADGTTLAATSVNAIYISTNSGSTWTPTESGAGDWFPIVLSADGEIMIAADWFGLRILVQQFTPKPVLNIANLNKNIVLSWIVPSSSLVLQQNSGLVAANWTNVTSALTLTNLQYQTTLPQGTNNMFFRLRSK